MSQIYFKNLFSASILWTVVLREYARGSKVGMGGCCVRWTKRPGSGQGGRRWSVEEPWFVAILYRSVDAGLGMFSCCGIEKQWRCDELCLVEIWRWCCKRVCVCVQGWAGCPAAGGCGYSAIGGPGAGLCYPARRAQGWVWYPAVRDRAGFVIPLSEQGWVCYPAAGLLRMAQKDDESRPAFVMPLLNCCGRIGRTREAGRGLRSHCWIVEDGSEGRRNWSRVGVPAAVVLMMEAWRRLLLLPEH